MALESPQPLIEMSIRNLPGGEERPARKADNLTAICEPTVQKMWKPRRLTILWAPTACFLFLICAVGLWVLRPRLAYCTSPG
jgi:hypothetical protein